MRAAACAGDRAEHGNAGRRGGRVPIPNDPDGDATKKLYTMSLHSRGVHKHERMVTMRFVWAFVIGGILCVVGQALIDKTKLTPARILVGYVVTGVALGAFGVYDKLVDLAGSGARVPLSGFGNLLAVGTKAAVDEQGLLGVLTGPLTAGAAGIMAAVLAGLVTSFFTRPKSK